MNEKTQIQLVDEESLRRALNLFSTEQKSDSAEHRLEYLEQQRQLYVLMWNGISDGAIIALPDGRTMKFNQAAERLLGVVDEHAQGAQVLDFFCNKSGKPWSGKIAKMLARQDELQKRRLYVRASTGRIIPVELAIHPLISGGLLVRYLIILKDLTTCVEQQKTIRRQMRQLKDSAMTDALTGLHNRTWLNYDFGSYIGRAQREETDLCTVFIDLDDFKQVNDRISYQAGDDILQKIADVLRDNVRAEDAIVRLGGDEFLIIMIMNRHDSLSTVSRLRDAIRAVPIPPNDNLFTGCITASIGIYVLDAFLLEDFDPKKPRPLIKEVVGQAEVGKHKVKAGGKDGIYMFSPKPPGVVLNSVRDRLV